MDNKSGSSPSLSPFLFHTLTDFISCYPLLRNHLNALLSSVCFRFSLNRWCFSYKSWMEIVTWEILFLFGISSWFPGCIFYSGFLKITVLSSVKENFLWGLVNELDNQVGMWFGTGIIFSGCTIWTSITVKEEEHY